MAALLSEPLLWLPESQRSWLPLAPEPLLLLPLSHLSWLPLLFEPLLWLPESQHRGCLRGRALVVAAMSGGCTIAVGGQQGAQQHHWAYRVFRKHSRRAQFGGLRTDGVGDGPATGEQQTYA